jgi:hypothetical protein
LSIPVIVLGEEIVIEHAEYAEYIKDHILFKGDVKMRYNNKILQAQDVVFNIDTGDVKATGNVIFCDIDRMLYGKELVYNFREGYGIASDIYVNMGKVIFRGCKAEIGTVNVILKKGIVTGCKLDKPHYGLYASTVKFYPHDKVIVKNIFFKVKDIPIFYLPYYVQSLKDYRPSFIAIPGYTEMDGNIFKSVYNYFFSEHSHGSVYLDYFQHRGIGCGLSHVYDRGNIGLYYINESYQRDYLLSTTRWNVDVYYMFQKNNISGRIYTNLASDAMVKRDYYQGTFEPELNSYVTICYIKNNCLYEMLVKKRKVWQPEYKRFVTTERYLPMLNIGTKFKPYSRIQYVSSVNITNQEDERVRWDAKVGMLWNYRLVRSAVFGHTIWVNTGNKDKSRWCRNSFNLRYKIDNETNLNLKYTVKNLQNRIMDNKLRIELYRIKNTDSLRLYTDIDLKSKLSSVFGIWKSNNIYINLEYVPQTGKLIALESGFVLHNDIFSIDIISTYLRNTLYEIGSRCNISITPDTLLQMNLYCDIKNNQIKRATWIIKKDLHCWEASIGFEQKISPIGNDNKKVREFWIRLNPKL